jgi:glycosyltransferase involved in cell wall biosynthesis
MASSLPVVATRVGSIPAFVEGAAELVEPRDTAQLAIAISRLVQHGERRQMLIREGRKIALENTLERRSLEMIAKIHNYLDEIK